MKPKISSHLWVLGSFAERYVPAGYYEDMNLEDKLNAMSKIEGFDGILIFYDLPPFPNDPDKIQKMLGNYGLEVANTAVENFSHRKWKHGALCTNEKKIREENIKLCKDAVDFTAEIPNASLRIWPAHDGFDYPFQVDYEEGWKYLTESYREICAHNPKVKVSIEYKQKDPRQRQYISNIGKMMMLFNDVGMDNFTGSLDTGHALMSLESLAEDAVILATHDKLNEVHLNENYRDADPDMIFGTVMFWENLELYYYLNQYAFKGWHEIDIIAPRDDRIKALELAVRMTLLYDSLAKKLLKRKDEIGANLKGYRFAHNMDLIIDILFGTKV
jgi:xylose isomerase